MSSKFVASKFVASKFVTGWLPLANMALAPYESAVSAATFVRSQLDQRRHPARGEQLAPEVDGDLVGRSEDSFERHGPLQQPVKRMIGREADAGEHLLAVRGDRARGAPRDRLRERGGDGVRFVARRGEGRVEASTATSASASRWRTAWKWAIGRPNCTRSIA